MQEILREYGGTILAGISAALILTLLFIHVGSGDKTGILGILGMGASIPGQVEAAESYEALEQHLSVGRPEVIAPDGVRAGRTYGASELFSKNSPEKIHMRILRVWELDEEEVSDQVISGDCLIFPREGVYRIRFWVENDKKESGVGEIYVGVNP